MANIVLDQITKGPRRRPQRIIISGTNGVGKSTWASEMPNPLFVDLEGGTNELDVARLRVTTEAALLDLCHELLEAEHDYKTLVIDSLDWLESALQKSVVQEHQKKAPGLEEVGDIQYGRGYAHTAKKMKGLLELFNQLTELRKNPMRICLICHTHVIKIQDPLIDDYDKIALKLHKKFGDLTKEWCDYLLFANFKIRVSQRGEGFSKTKQARESSDERVLYTRGSGPFDAKSRRDICDPVTGDHELPMVKGHGWASFNDAYNASFSETQKLKKSTKPKIVKTEKIDE